MGVASIVNEWRCESLALAFSLLLLAAPVPAKAQYFGGGGGVAVDGGEDVLDGGPSRYDDHRSPDRYRGGSFGPRDGYRDRGHYGDDRRGWYGGARDDRRGWHGGERRTDRGRHDFYRGDAREWRDAYGSRGYADPDRRYRPVGRSIVVYEAPSRSTYFRGTGIFANANPSGGVAYTAPGFEAADARPAFEVLGTESEPRIIDVEAERLDARPIGPDGISVTYAGGAKIIRIASAGEDDRVTTLESPLRTARTRPLDDGATASVERADAAARGSSEGFEPWTPEWRRDCAARHATFDVDLGTYRDGTGRRRFCTGDPS